MAGTLGICRRDRGIVTSRRVQLRQGSLPQSFPYVLPSLPPEDATRGCQRYHAAGTGRMCEFVVFVTDDLGGRSMVSKQAGGYTDETGAYAASLTATRTHHAACLEDSDCYSCGFTRFLVEGERRCHRGTTNRSCSWLRLARWLMILWTPLV